MIIIDLKLLMKIWKYIFKILFFIFIIVCISCSVNSSYKLARKLYLKKNYVAAIQQYDYYLKRTAGGADLIIAELERSECYYQLGLKALSTENWILAIKLFYLSNSQYADEKMDNCYFELAQIAMDNNNINEAMQHYDHIVSNLPTSELLSEILFNRIKINIELINYDSAFTDYDMIFMNYKDSEFSIKIQPVIDNILIYRIDKALASKNLCDYDTALEKLFKLRQYSTKHIDRINEEIADLYLLVAEKAMTEKNYQKAKENFLEVEKYNPQKKELAEQGMQKICNSCLSVGHELIKEQKFDEAINIYSEFLEFKLDCESVIAALEDAKLLRQNYIKAKEFESIALNSEEKKNFKEALKLYQQSYAFFEKSEVREKIQIMQNLIKAEEDPKGFAKSIIINYKNGKIVDLLNKLKNDLILVYSKDMVEISGWRVMYYSGEYKYELRYDILTPKKNYYYVWLVDLREKNVSPLNKASEKLM